MGKKFFDLPWYILRFGLMLFKQHMVDFFLIFIIDVTLSYEINKKASWKANSTYLIINNYIYFH